MERRQTQMRKFPDLSRPAGRRRRTVAGTVRLGTWPTYRIRTDPISQRRRLKRSRRPCRNVGGRPSSVTCARSSRNPVSAGCSPPGWCRRLGTACSTPGSPRTCSSPRGASPTRRRRSPRSPCCTCLTRCSGRSPGSSSTAGRGARSWSGRPLIRAALVALTALLVAEGTLGVPLYVSAHRGTRRQPVLPAPRLRGATARGQPGQAGDGERRGPDGGHDRGFIGGVAGPRGPPGYRRRPRRLGRYPAGRRRLLRGRRTDRGAMPRDLLGPTSDEAREARTAASVLADLVTVTHDLAAGARYAWRRRAAAAALCATGAQRLCYGVLLLMSILLYRNYFYHQSSSNTRARPLHARGDRLRVRLFRGGDPDPAA